MRPPVTAKYRFRIRTRPGAVLDNLLIPGRDPVEAERKLRQIYRGCEILDRDSPPDVAAQLQSSLSAQRAEKVVELFKPLRKVAGR